MRTKPYFAMILFTSLVLSQGSISAAIVSLEAGVDGVACSTCGYLLKKKIKKLDFVDEVKVAMSSAKALVLINNKSKLEIAEFDQAFIESGFSLRYTQIIMDGQIKQDANIYFIDDGLNRFRLSNIDSFQNQLNTALENKTKLKVYGALERVSDGTNTIKLERID